MGRKPLSGGVKTYRLQVMLTDEERQIVETAAAIETGKQTQMLSGWARDLILSRANEILARQKKPARKRKAGAE